MNRPYPASLLLFSGAAACGIWQLREPAFGLGQGFEMAAIARSLVAGGGFGNPFEPLITGPTAAEPPLYPLFLALIIKLFRRPEAIAAAATFANILVNGAVAALLPRLAIALFGDTLPGIAAAVLWIACCRLMPGWDASYTLLGLVVFCLFTAGKGGSVKRTLGAGAIAGTVTLLNPASLLVIIPWMVFTRMRQGLLVFALCAAANLPWLVRNYEVWGRPVVRSNFGMTLYTSNNDCARASLDANLASGCYAATHPTNNAAEAELLKAIGEVEYDRRRTAEALRWIRAHPGQFCRLTVQRIGQFWFPEPSPPLYTVWGTWVVTMLSVPGLLLLFRERRGLALLFLSVWAVYPAMYYIVVSGMRYRYPILWTSLLAAGYAVAAVLRRRSGRPA